MRAALMTVPSRKRAPDALERLFREHHDRVFRAAYRITGSAADAEDVLQTVFLRLARREGPAIEDAGVGSYLHRAAVHAAIDVLRDRRRTRLADVDEIGGEADPRPGPERRQEGREVADELRRAMATLAPRAAEIFTLRYLEGFGNREIARMLGTSWSTVAVTLHRARARLRRVMQDTQGGAR